MTFKQFEDHTARMKNRSCFLLSLILLSALMPRFARADGDPFATPDYSGDLWTRPTLTGDWFTWRTKLQDKGITFNADTVQVYQGVVNGGLDSGWRYGGRDDVNVHFDTQKMGLQPGGFVDLEGENHFGQFPGALQTGAVIPADVNSLFPEAGTNQFDLSSIMFTQFLAHQFGLFVGKLATISDTAGDMNEFAHGKGDEGFLNPALNFNTALVVTLPYSTLGTGFIILPTSDPKEFIITGSVFDMEGTSVTPGFNTVFKGGTGYALEGRYTTHFFNLTGHLLAGGVYSDKLYTSVNQGLKNFIIPGIPIQKAHGSWANYDNFDQYLYQPDPKVDRGVGVFGRFGITDGIANPVHYFYSVGFGAKGIIPSRPNDQCGIGWFYYEPSESKALSTLGFGSSEGYEAYYEIAITPWMHLTPDVQILDPSQHRIDNATVLGLRLTMTY